MRSDYQVYIPQLTLVNKIILITCGIVFLLESIGRTFGGQSFISTLVLVPEFIYSGQFHRLLLYPFAQNDFFGLLFDGLILWFIGSDLELLWGKKTYILFLLYTLLGTAFLYCLLPLLGNWFTPLRMLPLMGIQGMGYALLLAYGLTFKDRVLSFMMIFPLKAKYFCMLLIGVQLYLSVFSLARFAALGPLLSLFLAFLFISIRRWQLRQVLQMGQSQRGKSHSGFGAGSRNRPSHLKLVVSRDDEESPQEKHEKKGEGPKGPKLWQ